MTIQQEDPTIIGRPDRPAARRVLLLSLEFNFAPFSGNGVLARSLVSSLVRRDDCVVRVICARPHGSTPGLSKDICVANTKGDICAGDASYGDCGLEIWPVDLPEGCQWKRLDRSGPWERFASICGDCSLGFANKVKGFQPTDVVCVDWHGSLAWESICKSMSLAPDDDVPKTDEASWQPCSATVCYYNFRVYSASSYGESDDQFYHAKEQLSCRLADVIICLAEHDRCMIQKLIEDDSSRHEPVEGKAKNIHILQPPLRGDIWELASTSKDGKCFDRHLPPEAKCAIEKAATSKRRLFITCMARLSPEKSPHNFTALLKRLGAVDFLRKYNLIPLICGARSVESYARDVLDGFHEMLSSSSEDDEAWPCVVIDHNIGPKELAAVFSRTAVNVHPCLYDAYGMTLVEAAAFGAPSIVNCGGKVGAASLLGEGKGCMAVDLEKLLETKNESSSETTTMIDAIRGLLVSMNDSRESIESDNTLRQMAKEARSRALGWDEMSCCQGLIDALDGLPMR